MDLCVPESEFHLLYANHRCSADKILSVSNGFSGGLQRPHCPWLLFFKEAINPLCAQLCWGEGARAGGHGLLTAVLLRCWGGGDSSSWGWRSLTHRSGPHTLPGPRADGSCSEPWHDCCLLPSEPNFLEELLLTGADGGLTLMNFMPALHLDRRSEKTHSQEGFGNKGRDFH